MAEAEVRQVQAIAHRLHDASSGAYRSCALCAHGDERGMHCHAPGLHVGPSGMPAAQVRGSHGACGPHGLLLEVS